MTGDAPAAGHWRHGAALAAALIGFVLGAGSLTWRIDQSLYDGSLALWSRPVADDLVIVAIDDASLAAIGRWPWPRAVHATLLQTIAAAKPRAIALDLLLSEPDRDARADAALAAALERAAPVVLPTYFYSAPTRGPQELLPAPTLGTAARLAHMDTDTDADGVLRHAWLRAGIGDGLRPHLALALLEAAGERVHPSIATLRAPPSDGRAAAWRRDQRLLIRYAGPPGSVPAIPYASVLRGEVPAAVFAGKLVLIGATAHGLGDAVPTPVSGRAGPMAGVEVSAQLADALRGGHAVRAVPAWATGALAAALALLLFALFARASARRALQAAAAAVVLAPPASLLLMGAGLWLPPTALALTALIAYPLWSWRRLEAAHRFLDDELARWNDALPIVSTVAAPADEVADPLDRRLAAVRAAGERVRQARRFVADSLAALPEAVFVTDRAGVVLIANARAAALLDAADADALVGRPLGAVLAPLAPLEATGWRALIDDARHAGAARVTRARRGEQLDLLARLAPFGPPAGTARALVVSIADVTRLTSAERSRDELLAFVTHDLRSPQASLVSLAELARLGHLPLTPAQVLEQVELLARRTLALADDFLQIAGAEARELAPQRFDLAQCARDAIDETRAQAQLRAIGFAVDEPAQTLPVLGEPALVRRALVNLLTNAIKFSPQGGTIEVGVAAQDGQAVFHVHDQGPGIAPELRARLFRRYERGAEVARAPGALQGVGLGLVFVETVARRHGGQVALHSEPGRGARFELRLPLAADHGADAAARASPDAATDAAPDATPTAR